MFPPSMFGSDSNVAIDERIRVAFARITYERQRHPFEVLHSFARHLTGVSSFGGRPWRPSAHARSYRFLCGHMTFRDLR